MSRPYRQPNCFLTGRPLLGQALDTPGTIHIFDLRSGRETVVEGGPTGLGWGIGGTQKPGEPFTDYLIEVTPNEITLASRGLSGAELIVLNLESRRVETRTVTGPKK
jgi:hypothetical protein